MRQEHLTESENTGRGGPKIAVRVPVRTIDDIWREHGCPPVSVIKMDIEGGEAMALEGAIDTLARDKPILILEWNSENLKAYSVPPRELIQISARLGYIAYAFPGLTLINTEILLTMAMQQTETFVLVPQ